MAKAKSFTIEPLKETTLKLELIGDTDLILHKRSRYYEQAECWKQAHDKGTKNAGNLQSVKKYLGGLDYRRSLGKTD